MVIVSNASRVLLAVGVQVGSSEVAVVVGVSIVQRMCKVAQDQRKSATELTTQVSPLHYLLTPAPSLPFR